MRNHLQGPILPKSNQIHTYLEKFLIKLGEGNAFSVCIKDLKTKCIVLNNDVCKAFWGLPEETMYGMTTREVLARVPNFTNREQEVRHTAEREAWAVKNYRPSVVQQVLLSYDGFVQVRQSMITSLNGVNNRAIATAGIGLDITLYTDPLNLLSYYRYYYPKRSEAVAKFSTYFNLETYFYKPLCFEELRTLLAMLRGYRCKHIASSLQISPKTVSNYLFSMRAKLKEAFELQDLLRALHVKMAIPDSLHS